MVKSKCSDLKAGIDIRYAAEFLEISIDQAIEMGNSANEFAYSLLNGEYTQNALEKMYRESAKHYICRYNLPSTSVWWKDFIESIDENSKALDYGCGAAKPFQNLIGKVYDLTLADVPSLGFEFLKWRFGPAAKYIEIAEHFPLKQNYTHIICMNVCEHVSFPLELIKHLTEHLIQEGHLFYFFDVNPNKPGHLLESIRQKPIVDHYINENYELFKICDRGRLWLIKK